VLGVDGENAVNLGRDCNDIYDYPIMPDVGKWQFQSVQPWVFIFIFTLASRQHFGNDVAPGHVNSCYITRSGTVRIQQRHDVTRALSNLDLHPGGLAWRFQPRLEPTPSSDLLVIKQFVRRIEL